MPRLPQFELGKLIYLMFNKLNLTRDGPTEVGGIKLGNQRTESHVDGALIDVLSHGEDENLDLVLCAC
jgi:hypothetical protein